MANEVAGDVEVEDQNRDMLESQVKQIEQEMRDIKTRLFQQKLNDIRKELETVNDGTHVDFLEKDSGLIELREKRINNALITKTLMFESADRAYKAEEELATIEYNQGRMNLYSKIMARLQMDLDLCERDRRERDNRVHTPSSEKGVPRVRTPRTPRTPTSPLKAAPVSHRKVTAPTGRPIVLMLSESAIEDDLKNMKSVLRQQARHNSKANAASAPASSGHTDMHEATHVNGALIYNKKRYECGDEIWIESQVSGRYHATITSVNDCDLWVKCGQAPNKRLFITGLKLGKFKLRRCASKISKAE